MKTVNSVSEINFQNQAFFVVSFSKKSFQYFESSLPALKSDFSVSFFVLKTIVAFCCDNLCFVKRTSKNASRTTLTDFLPTVGMTSIVFLLSAPDNGCNLANKFWNGSEVVRECLVKKFFFPSSVSEKKNKKMFFM